MRASGAPAHLLLLDHAFADHLVDRGFHERGGDDLAGGSAPRSWVWPRRSRRGTRRTRVPPWRVLSCRFLPCWPPPVSSSSRSVVVSSTVCNERKTLLCNRNHFSRCSSAARVADSSGGTRRPLASWVSTAS